MPRAIGLFQSHFRADRCLAELKRQGFTDEEIRVILFSADHYKQPKGLAEWIANGGIFGDTIDQADGISVMDGMTVAASIGALWGLVWGSRLPWGPVTSGFTGLLGGGLVGLFIDRLIAEKRRALYETKRLKGLVEIEVVCTEPDRVLVAEAVLRRNEADQIATVPSQEPKGNLLPNP